jgi:SAM-dependent methyltransferase
MRFTFASDVAKKRAPQRAHGQGKKMMGDWIAFWDSQHAIYVNARHLDVHYRRIAEDVGQYLPSRTATVLDYGCGEALHADRIATAAGRLILIDAAPTVRAGLLERFKDRPNIEVRSPQELSAIADRSVDLVVMHSVAQYLTKAQLNALLIQFRRMLSPGGLLVLGDVLRPNVSALMDMLSLLTFGAANGFFFAAVSGLFRTFLSDYRRLRSTLGLTRYAPAEIKTRLDAAGFSASRAPTNIGHNWARMTFIARPA